MNTTRKGTNIYLARTENLIYFTLNSRICQKYLYHLIERNRQELTFNDVIVFNVNTVYLALLLLFFLFFEKPSDFYSFEPEMHSNYSILVFMYIYIILVHYVVRKFVSIYAIVVRLLTVNFYICFSHYL